MPETVEGTLSATGRGFAIVASRFNDDIVDGLLRGALECLERHGAKDEDLVLYRVPGAFEIPALAGELAGRYDAIIALGCLIRGDTPHFDFICSSCADGIARVTEHDAERDTGAGPPGRVDAVVDVERDDHDRRDLAQQLQQQGGVEVTGSVLEYGDEAARQVEHLPTNRATKNRSGEGRVGKECSIGSCSRW